MAGILQCFCVLVTDRRKKKITIKAQTDAKIGA